MSIITLPAELSMAVSSSTSTKNQLHIGVLLGDPNLPCSYTVEGDLGEEWVRSVKHLKEILPELPDYRFTYFDNHERLIEELRDNRPDLMLNLCDMGYRNNWEMERNVPALLELLDIPYTGADPASMTLSADKALVSLAAMRMGIAVPNENFVDLTASPLLLPATYPAMIKPNASGGSFGMIEDCVVHDDVAAEAYLRWLAGQLDRPEAVIQDFLTGREFTVGLIGNPAEGFTVLPPMEVDFSGLDPDLVPIQSYGWKADPESRYIDQMRLLQADIDEVTYSHLVDASARLFKRLGLRDYCRIDFRCGDDGVPRVLDVNTNPSWYFDSKLATMAEWAGYSYARMLGLIIEAAAVRNGLNR